MDAHHNPTWTGRIRDSAAGITRSLVYGAGSHALGNDLAELRSSHKTSSLATNNSPPSSAAAATVADNHGRVARKRKLQSFRSNGRRRRSEVACCAEASKSASEDECCAGSASASLLLPQVPVLDLCGESVWDDVTGRLSQRATVQSRDDWLEAIGVQPEAVIELPDGSFFDGHQFIRLEGPSSDESMLVDGRSTATEADVLESLDQSTARRRLDLLSRHLASTHLADATSQNLAQSARHLGIDEFAFSRLSFNHQQQQHHTHQQMGQDERNDRGHAMQESEAAQTSSAHQEVRQAAHATTSPHRPSPLEDEMDDTDFHCPFVLCHQHLANGMQYIRTPSGALEGLECVHAGCYEAFTQYSDWKEHINTASHHDLLPLSSTSARSDSESEHMEDIWVQKAASLDMK